MTDPVTVRRPIGDNASTATLYYLGERLPKEDEKGDDGILEFFGVEDT